MTSYRWRSRFDNPCAENLPGHCADCGDPLAWVGLPGSNRIHAWPGRLGLPERPYNHPASVTDTSKDA
jgi:hypothetical protein